MNNDNALESLSANLVRFDKVGIEILINSQTGESFASISGYARMSGKDKSTISRRCTVAFKTFLKAQIQTTTGLKTVVLISEDTIIDWIIDDNPALAKRLLKAGVRVFLHELAGYRVTSTAVEKVDPIDALIFGLQELKKVQADLELLKQRTALESQRTDHLQEVVEQLDAELERIFKPDGDYYTIRAYAKIIGLKTLSLTEAKALGKKATQLSKEKGVTIDQLPDPRYGTVGCCSEHILAEIFNR